MLAAAVLAASCALSARTEGGGSRDAAGRPADRTEVRTQGIAGRFEALGGARLPEPGCETLESDAARDSCEKDYLRQMTFPLQGSAVIHPPAGDSLVIPLDDSGAYRAVLPPGLYTICVRADALEDVPGICQDSIEVVPGRFTPYSRPFPMP